MPATVAIEYADLFEFLEDYRSNLSQLQYTVALEGAKVGDDVALAVQVPVLGETVMVPARVMAPLPSGAGLQLDPDAPDGLPRLEGFYRFVGQLVEAMLRSGRFKVAGEWGEGVAAPATAAARPAAAPSTGPTLGPATHSGQVNEKNLTQLLMTLYSERAVGVLELQGGVAIRRAWIKQGGIVAWEAEPVLEQECLGVLLVRSGRLTEDQLKATLTMMNETGMKQGECLIEMGVYTFPQIVMSLMTQVELVTRNVFVEAGGTYSFHPLPDLGREFITPPMKSPGFLFKYYRRHFATVKQEVVEGLENPLKDSYTRLAEANWDDFRFSKVERGLIDILARKSYRYREAFRVSNVGRSATSQILLSLVEMGVLDFVADENIDQVAARWRAELGRKLLLQRDQNPFELLEIHWTSRDPQVEEAYQRMRTEYENYGRGKPLPADVEAMRTEILEAIQASYERIKSIDVRRETRKEYYEPQQHEFSADLLFTQGEMLMVRHQWATVIDNFERAIELMPNIPKYRQYLQQAEQKQRSGGGGSFED